MKGHKTMCYGDVKKQIEELLPELKKAIRATSRSPDNERIMVGGVDVDREDAVKMCKEFEKVVRTRKKPYKLSWEIIPLRLISANSAYRALL